MLVEVASLPHSRPEYRHFTLETDKTAYTFATQCTLLFITTSIKLIKPYYLFLSVYLPVNLNYYLSYDVCAVSVLPSFRPSVCPKKKLLNGCKYQKMSV